MNLMKLVQKLEAYIPKVGSKTLIQTLVWSERDPNRRKKLYTSACRGSSAKKTTKFFYLGKGEDMVRTLGTGPGLILERECPKDEQGDSDDEWTSDQEQTNQMTAP
jgi:hypothetical protein